MSFNGEHPVNHGAWDQNSKFFKEWILCTDNPTNHAAAIAFSSSQIWKDTIYYEASHFDETSRLLNCDFFPTIDKARDLFHPGRESARQAAIQIYNNIQGI